MPVSVQAPNGDTVDFPDGTDDATINSAMAKAYGAQTQAPANGPAPSGPAPGPNGASPVASPPPPENQWLGFEQGADRVLDNASTFLSHTPVIGPMIDNSMGPDHTAAAIRAAHERYFADQQAQGHGRPGGAGDLAGVVTAEAPLALVTRNPWIGGAAGGGLATHDPNNPTGVAVDTGLGALGGKVFQAGTQALGNAINPLVRTAVQRMIAAGVHLTPGQVLGGTPQMIENAMRFLPGVGDMVSHAQGRTLTDFNNAAYNEVLSHIGGRLPAGVTGHDAATYTQQAISDEYGRILPSLKIQYDQPFFHDVIALRRAVNSGTLPTDKAGQFFKILANIGNRFSSGGGMTGRTMQEVDTSLGQQYRAYKGSSSPDDQNMAGYILQAQRALREMVYRANPTRREELQGVRAAYQHFVPVETAAGAGSTDHLGRFQPGDLKNVVAANDGAVNNRTMAQGRAPMQGLAEDAQDTLGRSIPKPNPINRLLMAGGGALGALAAHLHPATLAPGALLAAPYTRMGGALMREALTGRQGPIASAVGNAVRSAAPAAARVGGAMVPKRRNPTSTERVP